MGCCASTSSAVSGRPNSPRSIFDRFINDTDKASVSKGYAGNQEFKRLSLKEKKATIGLKNLQMTNQFDNSYAVIKKKEWESIHKSFVSYTMAQSLKKKNLAFVALIRMANVSENSNLIEVEYFQHLDIYRTLNCPGVPRVLDVFHSANVPGDYTVVYEYVQGKDLRAHFEDQQLPERHVVRVMMQKLAVILQCIHSKRVIHGGLCLNTVRCDTWPWATIKNALDIRFINFDRYKLYLTGFSKCDICVARSDAGAGTVSVSPSPLPEGGVHVNSGAPNESKHAAAPRPNSDDMSKEEKNRAIVQAAADQSLNEFRNVVTSRPGYSRAVSAKEETHLFLAPELVVMENELRKLRERKTEDERRERLAKEKSTKSSRVYKTTKFNFDIVDEDVKSVDDVGVADVAESMGPGTFSVSISSANHASARANSGSKRRSTTSGDGGVSGPGDGSKLRLMQESPLNAETISSASNGHYSAIKADRRLAMESADRSFRDLMDSAGSMASVHSASVGSSAVSVPDGQQTAQDTINIDMQLVHTFAIDIYAFGMIYASCIVGLQSSRETMEGQLRKSFGPKVKPAVPWEYELITKCISLNPLERPSIDELLTTFDKVL